MSRPKSEYPKGDESQKLIDDLVQPTSGDKPSNPHAPPTIEIAPPHVRAWNVRCSGATAPDGTPWVLVEPTYAEGAPSVWTQLADWLDDAAAARQRLRDGNLYLFGDYLKGCMDEARKVRSFPPLPLIDRPGWTPPHYALPSGAAFSPAGTEPAIVIFGGDPQRFGTKGGKEWLTRVGHLAKGQSIITFTLMIGFMGPLLRLSRLTFNPGFELTGLARVGKSSAQLLVASLVGAAVAQDGQNAWLPANTTTNAIEERLADHNDFILIIEEMSLFYADAGDKTRGIKLRDLVFKLASGTAKSRYQSTEQKPARFVYLTSSNETLSGLIGSTGSRTSAAAGARLLTIPIDAGRPYGVFDELPEGFETSEAAVRAITDLVEDHYGKPIHHFICELVNERAADEAKLKRRIARYMDEFREAVGVDENVGPEASIADVFGLAYAAGRLAKRYGALPKSLKCLSSAVKVYRMNRELGGAPPSYVERLRRLALRKGVIHVDPKELQDISNSDLGAAPALVRFDRQGRKEILLTEAHLDRAFPFKRDFFDDPGVQAILQRDSDQRRTVKRTVRTSKRQERFYVFTLSASENGN